MKKQLLCAAIAVLSFLGINGQETKFGVIGGYNSLIAKATFNGVTASSSVSGFYVGIFADIKTSEKFHVQPELQYVNSIQNGDTGSMLALPIMGKFYVSEAFSVQAGPQFDLILDDSEGVKAFGVGLAVGVSYDISEKIFASTRYALGLSNRLDEDALVLDPTDPILVGFDIKTKFNFFQIGLGYRF